MTPFEEAIILAAGRGRRLGAMAGGGPKCLVEVAISDKFDVMRFK